MDRPLTYKEQLVVEQFDKLRPGYGEIARRNILNNHLTGWADIANEMTEEQITLANLSTPTTHNESHSMLP